MYKPQVIVIIGPTASGKTSASIELAKRINGEIISADSMQVYKDMNIGTAKVTKPEMEGIKHHLIDVISPNENFNVTKYKKLAETAIEEIVQSNKIPIIVGGTGLYINTLTNGIEFAKIGEDEAFRKEMQRLADEKGAIYLHNELKKIDSDSANKIDINNIRRVIRALEIYKITGITKTELDARSRKETKYNYKMYGIVLPRDILYDRINKRVDQMLEKGLIEEVKKLLETYDLSSTALQGLGYKEVKAFLNNEITYEDMVEKIKTESRKYAKRQLTWFKRDERIIWCELSGLVDRIITDIS